MKTSHSTDSILDTNSFTFICWIVFNIVRANEMNSFNFGSIVDWLEVASFVNSCHTFGLRFEVSRGTISECLLSVCARANNTNFQHATTLTNREHKQNQAILSRMIHFKVIYIHRYSLRFLFVRWFCVRFVLFFFSYTQFAVRSSLLPNPFATFAYSIQCIAALCLHAICKGLVPVLVFLCSARWKEITKSNKQRSSVHNWKRKL